MGKIYLRAEPSPGMKILKRDEIISFSLGILFIIYGYKC